MSELSQNARYLNRDGPFFIILGNLESGTVIGDRYAKKYKEGKSRKTEQGSSNLIIMNCLYESFPATTKTPNMGNIVVAGCQLS